MAKSGLALAWRLTPTWPSLAGLHRGKGVHSPGLLNVGSSGRATSRRGLGVVWPEKGSVMTRARALKQVIRARAAKTGERYTTARRHVLRELDQPAPVAKATKKTAAPTKGGLSDAKSIEKTGHELAHWFAILDRFGGIEKGHTASAD